MAEFIEREKVISVLTRLHDKCGNDDMAFALRWAIQSVGNIPCATFVRCEDCEFGTHTGMEYKCEKHSGHEERFGEDVYLSEFHPGCYFCSDGEEKEDD